MSKPGQHPLALEGHVENRSPSLDASGSANTRRNRVRTARPPPPAPRVPGAAPDVARPSEINLGIPLHPARAPKRGCWRNTRPPARRADRPAPTTPPTGSPPSNARGCSNSTSPGPAFAARARRMHILDVQRVPPDAFEKEPSAHLRRPPGRLVAARVQHGKTVTPEAQPCRRSRVETCWSRCDRSPQIRSSAR